MYPDLSDNAFNFCNMQHGAELYHSGYGHHYFNNTCLLASGSSTAYDYGDCNLTNAEDPPRTSSYGNRFLSPGAGAGGLGGVPLTCGAGPRLSMAQWQLASGMEAGSVGGPLPDPAALAEELLAFLPGPQAGGGGGAWGR